MMNRWLLVGREGRGESTWLGFFLHGILEDFAVLCEARGLDLVHGLAGWMHRAGLESILGLRRRGSTFAIDPCIPSSWPEYSTVWRFGRTRYEISVLNPERRYGGIAEAELDRATATPGPYLSWMMEAPTRCGSYWEILR